MIYMGEVTEEDQGNLALWMFKGDLKYKILLRKSHGLDKPK